MKTRPSKLDAHAERLEEWFLGGKTLAEAQEQLRQDGCAVSLGRLSQWWSSRQSAIQEEQLLQQIASGANQCREVEEAFGDHPAPEMETIIKLQRVLILKISTQANVDPQMLDLVGRLTKPAMDYAKLMAKQREMDLSEQKYRDQVAERRRAIEAEISKAKGSGGITAETMGRIEAELRLL